MGVYQTLDQYFITNTLTGVIKSKIIQPKNEVGIKIRVTLLVALGTIRPPKWPWVWSEKQYWGQNFKMIPIRKGDTRLLSH